MPSEIDRAREQAREGGEHLRQAERQLEEAREQLRARRAEFAKLLELGGDVALKVLEAVVVLGASAAMAEIGGDR